jgi:creatinine amidohydrolase/Fe(II)-dependent formamide hydrolase-like protein
MLQAPKVGHFKTFKELTQKGTFGNPTFASIEKGALISKILIGQCVEVLKEIYSK